MLEGSESNIQLLLGHYAHSMGCFHESALHFMQASKVYGDLTSLEILHDTYLSDCLEFREPGVVLWLYKTQRSCLSRIAEKPSPFG